MNGQQLLLINKGKKYQVVKRPNKVGKTDKEAIWFVNDRKKRYAPASQLQEETRKYPVCEEITKCMEDIINEVLITCPTPVVDMEKSTPVICSPCEAPVKKTKKQPRKRREAFQVRTINEEQVDKVLQHSIDKMGEVMNKNDKYMLKTMARYHYDLAGADVETRNTNHLCKCRVWNRQRVDDMGCMNIVNRSAGEEICQKHQKEIDKHGFWWCGYMDEPRPEPLMKPHHITGELIKHTWADQVKRKCKKTKVQTAYNNSVYKEDDTKVLYSFDKGAKERKVDIRRMENGY
jgi:hypothetical protein